MRACSESHMAIGAAARIESSRIVKLRRIVIGRDIIDHHPVARLDLLPANLDILSRCAHEMLHRCRPADRFLDKPRQ